METKTEVKAEAKNGAIESAVVGGAEIAKAEAKPEAAGVAKWEAPNWNAERVALAKKAVTPPTATDAEFEYFIAWCKRTGLDPFVKQAYLIERRAQDAKGNWVAKHEPMASEAGLAARADAEPDFRGIESAAVYEGDVFRVVRMPDGSTGIHHEWSPVDRMKSGNKLLGAWAHAKRAGRTVKITWLPLASRIQTTRDGKITKFWATMPEGQIEKCARAEQYRLAYPNIFGSAYIPEEMPDDEPYVDGAVLPKDPPPAASTKSATDALAAKLAEKVGPKPTPPAASSAPASPAPTPNERQVQYGPHKGLPISGLDGAQLGACIDFCAEKVKAGEAKLKSAPNDEKVKAALGKMQEELAVFRAEEKKRIEIVDDTEAVL